MTPSSVLTQVSNGKSYQEEAGHTAIWRTSLFLLGEAGFLTREYTSYTENQMDNCQMWGYGSNRDLESESTPAHLISCLLWKVLHWVWCRCGWSEVSPFSCRFFVMLTFRPCMFHSWVVAALSTCTRHPTWDFLAYPQAQFSTSLYNPIWNMAGSR